VSEYGKQATSDDPWRREVRGSWWPFDLSPAPNPSPVDNFIQLVSHLASEMKWSSIPPKVNQTLYSEWHFIHIRFHHITQQLEISFGLNSSSSSTFYSSQEQQSQASVSMYCAPHGYAWVSLVMNISCDMRITLRPVQDVSVYVYIYVRTRIIAKHEIVRYDCF